MNGGRGHVAGIAGTGRPAGGGSDSDGGLPAGAPARSAVTARPPSASATFLAEVVGDEAASGKLLPLGVVLEMMDLVAGRVAYAHRGGGPVATVSFDRVDMLKPILHLDLVTTHGRVVSVGASSIVVEVRVTREDRATRQAIPAVISYVTMVAVDPETRRPFRGVATLTLESPDDTRRHAEAARRKALTATWTRMQKAVDERAEAWTAAEVEDPINADGKTYALSMAETAVTVRKQYLPRHKNFGDAIFGGDILAVMDKTALYTARRFSGNATMVVIGLDRISFQAPVLPLHVLHLVARVVYVRRYTVEVEVHVSLDRRVSGEPQVSSHVGSFTVLNLDEAGFKRPVMVGLKLDDADQEGLRTYEKAKQRFYFGRSNGGEEGEANVATSKVAERTHSFWLN
ncbi:hypothetical protein BU14_0513s0005 [Porphyra umbilicalis]|uniref:HotDog ACOT-type domain-containing protein n=1 Tax=Porphyra umbilicalis TaxID=2786 RepID=A0A1X6NSS6_PORUM|nr:hypothetical protein BU14_0513s0005 [Porphyra umbilicalis]|eukprot:OSX71661.1 hypothetical protein BU14_0513s0005 [Porphyra umbilicalis]